MRLAVVTSHPIQYQAPLFRALAQRCDLHVLFAHRATKADQAAAGFEVPFDWDVDLTSGYSSTFMRNVSSQPSLEAFSGCDTPDVGGALVQYAPDAVLLMGWHLKCYWQSIWACRRAQLPVMVRGDSHLNTPRRLIKRVGKAMVYPLALRVFDAALYVGEQSRRYWLHYGYPTDRMYFSPHCIDNDWFAERATLRARAELRRACGVEEGVTLALFAGKLEPLKRVADIVGAVAQCRATGERIELMVAGTGKLHDSLQHVAAEAGVPYHALGFCNQSRMPSVYAAADILVLASESETWGLVANEALACGKPLIVSDRCGCAYDLAADGTAGSVFHCGDVADLAQSMRRLIDQPPSHDAIAAKANRYSIDTAANGIVEAMSAFQPTERSRARRG
ncbi:glycosyltransferase family 4 protein [Methylocystis silviterrae]|uniref:glycosyltransferase family 4 protein n=1 Tax=Methylocystis silviterrae TaxID=2743612 RepID=UPI001E414E45|nr:glycosyltransferase family 4 protein [Methylocystis silviterrae]